MCFAREMSSKLDAPLLDGSVRIEMERPTIKDIAISFTTEITLMCDKIKGRDVFVKQIIRSVSSIGANAYEAKYAQSDADFINNFEIALKECHETEYWLEILYRVGSISKDEYAKHINTCGILQSKIIASIRTVKRRIQI